ncbi:MAG: type II toxin-antitoxin system VapC family toxin [Candidatus Bathyarchaeota archaeon]|nr:type II toxin-antitoxin system VapC family toxin [Candidatus Bathyarchaeota archaeon]
MIFVDTSAWYALEVEDEINHRNARKFLSDIATGQHGVAITTDYVLDETLTLLQSRKGLPAALEFIDKIRKSKSVRIFWVSESLFDKALSIFRKTSESKWSFTDCTSFALMADLAITEAFTLDSHFEQAGFHKLP